MFTLHSPVFAKVRLSLFSQLISCHSLETPPSLKCSWHSPVFAKERFSFFSQLISFKSLLLYLETQPFSVPDLVSVSKLCYSYHKKGAFDWMTNGFYPWGGVFSPVDNGTAFLRSDCRSALSSRENLTRLGMSLVWVWVGEEDCVGLVFRSLREPFADILYGHAPQAAERCVSCSSCFHLFSRFLLHVPCGHQLLFFLSYNVASFNCEQIAPWV